MLQSALGCTQQKESVYTVTESLEDQIDANMEKTKTTRMCPTSRFTVSGN